MSEHSHTPYLKNNISVSAAQFTQAALEPAHSVVVRACAGSGKTWLLTSRIIRLLIAGVEPKHILAITFTKKAAQEMRDRVAQLLREMADGTPEQVMQLLTERGLTSEQAQASLVRAQSLYNEILGTGQELPIHTFDAWFYRLLKAAPMGSGVSRDAGLLVDADNVREAAWKDFFELFNQTSASSDDSVRTHYLNLVAQIGAFNVEKMLSSALYASNDFELWQSQVGPNIEDALEALRMEILEQTGLDVAAGEAGIQMQTHHAIMATGNLSVLMRSLDVGDEKKKARADNLQNAINTDNTQVFWDALRNEIAPSTGLLNGTSYKTTIAQRAAMLDVGISAEDYNDARDAVNAQLERMQMNLADLQAYQIHTDALPCAFALLEQYRKHKRSANAVEFADVSRQCFELLNSPATAAFMQTQLDARYRHLLFDEFQDTNPVQWGIINGWLSAYQGDVDKPHVFLVGDVKQSIYRFRDADSTLFALAQDYLVDGFDATVLQTQFTRRNSPAVVEWVNRMFGREDSLLDDFLPHTTDQTTRIGHIACLGLIAAAPDLDTNSGSTSALAASEDAPVEPTLDVSDTPQRDWLHEPAISIKFTQHDDESAQLVQAIQSLVHQYPVWDEALEAYRVAQYSDMMILVYGRTHLSSYERLLRQARIPFESTRRGGLMDTLEALDLMALLQWLMREDDDWALVQVLRAPMFAMSDAQLMQLYEFKSMHDAQEESSPVSKSSYWQALSTFAEQHTDNYWQRTHALLREWLECAQHQPAHDVLDRIYAQGDIYNAYARVVPSWLNPQVQSNLRAFLQLALNANSGRYPSLSGLLHELARSQERAQDGQNEGEPLGMHNAVKILTVHASKGLEAPIVMLIDMRSSNPKPQGNKWFIQRQGSPIPAHLSWLGKKDTQGLWRASALADESALSAKEHYNKCYVAMTRAKQMLIVSAAQEMDEERDEHGEIQAVRPQKKMDGLFEHLHAESMQLTSALPHAPEQWTNIWQDYWDSHPPEQNLSEQQPNTSSRSEFATDPIYIPEIVANDEGIARWRKAPEPVQEDRATQLGTALHQALEWASDPHHPQQLSAQLIAQRCALSSDMAQTVFERAQIILSHEAYRSYFDPSQYNEAHNEMAVVDAQGKVKRIDRWVRHGQRITVIDYKSAWNEQNLPEYEAQVQEYMNVLAQIYPQMQLTGILLRVEGEAHKVIMSS